MARTSFVLAVCAMFCSTAAVAIEWEVEPAVAVTATYSDNLELVRDAVKDDDFVTEFVPQVAISGVGQKIDLDLEYRLQWLKYSRRSDFDDSLGYATADGVVTLVNDALFVNFGGSLNQQILDPAGAIPTTSISAVGNRGEVLSASVNPYWTREIGKTSRIMLSYTAGLVEFDDPAANPGTPNETPLNDSKNGRATAVISGSPPRAPWAWRLEFNDSQIDYDNDAEVSLRRSAAELGWTFGTKAQLFVSGGEEENDYNRSLGMDDLSGGFWNAGLRGELDRRTIYDFSFGEEHYGDSYSLLFRRTAGKLMTDVSYSEQTTTSGYQQLDYETLVGFLTDVEGSELPRPEPSVYVRKLLTIVGNLTLARSTLQLTTYLEKREYLTSPTEESDRVKKASVSWNWNVQPRGDFNIRVGWQQVKLRDNSETPEDLWWRLRYAREIGKTLTLHAQYSRNSRFATNPTFEYDANSISLGLKKRF